MKTVIALPLLIALSGVPTFSQTGVWRTHTAMHDIRGIAAVSRTLWAATSGGVFACDLSTGAYTTYTNVEGLPDIDITAIIGDWKNRILCGSTNGSIAVFVAGEGWHDVPDIRRATDKPKRGIRTFESHDSSIFIGTDFGVVVYKPDRREFGDTYVKFGTFTAQTPVNDIFIFDDIIWIATDQGVARAGIRSVNLQDPSVWTSYKSADGLPVGPVRSLNVIDGIIIAGTDRGIYEFQGGQWLSMFQELQSDTVSRLVSHPSGVFAVSPRQIFDIRSRTSIERLGESTVSSPYPLEAMFSDVVRTSDGQIAAASGAGFSLYRQQQPWSFRKPNGPASNRFYSLAVDANGILWSGSGGENVGIGMYSWDGIEWKHHSLLEETTIGSDAVFACAATQDGSMLFSVWGRGVVRRTAEGKYTVYTKANVPELPTFNATASYAVITGMAQDQQGNMWFLNLRAGDGAVLACMKPDGTWQVFRNQSFNGRGFSELVIDSYGNKWFHSASAHTNKELVRFNENGTLGNPDDDDWRSVDSRTLLSEGGDILSHAIDQLGDIWVGTGLGLRTIFDPRQPEKVSRTCYNTRCNIEGQIINCIAIDPCGNKWLGTTAGVFVLSADGSTILEQYSAGNSLLLEDNVRTIAIDPVTGTAYFGTPRGLSSLTTPCAKPAETSDRLSIWPNPFRPGLDEHITIDGLVEASTIKVLTVSGDLVTEVLTPGGRVGFWDGRTSGGEYVPSGIYYIVAYGADGSSVSLSKVAVVRP